MSGLGDLLGSVVGGAMPGSGNAQQGGGSGQLVGLVMGLINQHGGIGGLIQQFEKAGLGQAAQSWVGTGQNQEISGDQVTQALGQGTIGQIAQQLGLDHGAAGGMLAKVLPRIVDKLTPQGQVGDHSQLADLAKQLMGGKLFG